MKKYVLLLTSILLFSIQSVEANTYHFKHFEVGDGLSNNDVSCCLQDKAGFMWFGTRDGLNRFDGINFKVYKNNPDDPYSIGSNWINCMVADAHNDLWIGTDAGLYKYNYLNETFTCVEFTQGIYITTLTYDPEGYLWVYMRNVMVKYDPNNFVIYRYADILLKKAEALNEQGKTAEAAIPLNIVRQRAGLPAVPASLSQEDMRQKIIQERRMELAFEGHRWFDMIRINKDEYALQFLKSIDKNNVTKDRLLFPIPQTEMDANDLMEQNPGY